MRKWIITLVVAALAVTAFSVTAAQAENGNDDEGTPTQICAGGITWPIPEDLPEDQLQAMFERGTVWLFELKGVTGISLLGPPPPIINPENVREVPFTVGACAAASGPPAFVAPPARVGVCSPQLLARANGSLGHFHDIAIEQWLDPDSRYFGMPAAKYVKGGPESKRGINCDQLPGYTATGKLVDGSGGQGGGDGQVYPEYVFSG
ncbi:MAG: hypothetical protein WDZ34_02060 [Candidatus Saccharimonadales bacterium]